MCLVDEVELALLGRTAGADQFVRDVFKLEIRHRVLDHGFLIGIQRFLGHVHDGDTDSRIENIQEGIVQSALQHREPLRHVALAVDVKRNNLLDGKFVILSHLI